MGREQESQGLPFQASSFGFPKKAMGRGSPVGDGVTISKTLSCVYFSSAFFSIWVCAVGWLGNEWYHFLASTGQSRISGGGRCLSTFFM